MESLTKSIKIEVSNLDNVYDYEFLSSFVADGWTLKSVIPVTDEGKPFLLFIIEKKKYKKDRTVTALLILIILIQITNLFM